MIESVQPPESTHLNGAQLSAGAQLRSAREAAGLHVAALAVSLKVPPRKLEALEADRYEELGDVVFVRALAASVCRSLKLDPKPVLAELPQGTPPRLQEVASTINTPMPVGGHSPVAGGLGRLLGRPPVLAALGLGLAAALLLWLPPLPDIKHRLGFKSDDAVGARNEAPGFPPAAAPSPAADNRSTAGTQDSVSADPRPGASDAASGVPVSPASGLSHSPALASMPAAVPASGPSSGAAAPVVNQNLIIQVRDRSWVDVTNDAGQAVFRRTLHGETVELPIAAGSALRVTIGNAAGTHVSVRGKPIDLAVVTRDNVARLEVK